MKSKILCPDCDVECVQYKHYKTVGECPKCRGLFTTKDGDAINVYNIQVGEQNDTGDDI